MVEAFRVDRLIDDGEILPLAGGLKVVHVPGHCAGQVALLWQNDRLLIGADAFMNLFGFGDPIGFEDEAEGRRSQKKIARVTFGAAVFGHGPAITENAVAKVRRVAEKH